MRDLGQPSTTAANHVGSLALYAMQRVAEQVGARMTFTGRVG